MALTAKGGDRKLARGANTWQLVAFLKVSSNMDGRSHAGLYLCAPLHSYEQEERRMGMDFPRLELYLGHYQIR